MICLKRGFALVAIGVLGLMLAGCAPDVSVAPTEPPVVTVSQPIEKEITDYDQYTGRIEAAKTVEVRTRVRGELTKIHFKDGAIVKEGDPLFEIDARPYQALLDVEVAERATAEAEAELADTEYKRTDELYRKNAASAKEVAIWIAKKKSALAELKKADADINRVKLDVEFCKIKAGIAGRISRPLVTEGNLINAGGGDMLLTTIVSVDPIYVYFDVDERALGLYRERHTKEGGGDTVGKPPAIPVFLGLISDGDRFPREGVVDFAENRLNPATGTIRVRGVFANKDGRLTPGQFARVRLPVGAKYQGLLVLDSAIGIDQGQKYVLVVDAKNKVEYRPVSPGRLEGGLRIFPPGAGLKAGEWVVVNGVQRVRPGVQVSPDQVPMPTPPTAGGKSNGGKKTGA